MYAIDASAAVEVLLKTGLGMKVAAVLGRSNLVAPELLDVEVLSVLRRGVFQKKLTEDRAALALADLVDWHLVRIPHRLLVREAWRHRHNASGCDAFYIAAARLNDASLVTADGPLARSEAAFGISILNIRLS